MQVNSVPTVAIVDYGLGNLYSVARACERVGLAAHITSDRREIVAADGVILPGVGAFGDAMQNLRGRDLVGTLRQIAFSDTPLLGICLGQQLLMSESEEFGLHEGLNIIPGRVVHFGQPQGSRGRLKVPQVGWNGVFRPYGSGGDPWTNTPLAGLRDGTYMYFVHSFYVQPRDSHVVLSITQYGDIAFCSAIRSGNVFACQFHPERSGEEGIRIYQSFAEVLVTRRHGRQAEAA